MKIVSEEFHIANAAKSPVGRRVVTVTTSEIRTYTLDEGEYGDHFDEVLPDTDEGVAKKIESAILDDGDCLTPFDSGDSQLDGDMTVVVERRCARHPEATIFRDACWYCRDEAARAAGTTDRGEGE